MTPVLVFCLPPKIVLCGIFSFIILSSGDCGKVVLPLIRGEIVEGDVGGGPQSPPVDSNGSYERNLLTNFAGSL